MEIFFGSWGCGSWILIRQTSLLCDHWQLRRTWASAQSYQGIRCSHTHRVHCCVWAHIKKGGACKRCKRRLPYLLLHWKTSDSLFRYKIWWPMRRVGLIRPSANRGCLFYASTFKSGCHTSGDHEDNKILQKHQSIVLSRTCLWTS